MQANYIYLNRNKEFMLKRESENRLKLIKAISLWSSNRISKNLKRFKNG